MNKDNYLTDKNKEALSPRDTDAALAEIERTLYQMLMLATVSASNLDVDRATLQATLERLQGRINHIADQIPSSFGTGNNEKG